MLSVGFYNLENLFDTQNDPYTFDKQFLPKVIENGPRRGMRKSYKT